MRKRGRTGLGLKLDRLGSLYKVGPSCRTMREEARGESVVY